MSQPPQDQWGQQSGEPYGQDPNQNPDPNQGQDPNAGWGQPSPNAGYGQDQPGYGQPSPNAGYGQDQPGYGQDQYGNYGQASPNAGYGQPSANDYGAGFGPDGQPAGDIQQGGKKPGSKLPLLICAGCAVLALLLGLVGGGIFLFTRDGGEPTGGGTTTTEPGGDETTEPGGDETTEPGGDETTEPGGDETTEPGGDETTEPAGDGDKGTRDNPYAVDEKFTMPDGEGGEVEVSFGAVNWDATAEIKEENQFNEDPGEGEVHIMVPVTITYHGPDSVSPSFLLSIDYVADSGNSFSQASLVVPNGSLDQGELYDGGTATYNLPFTIPADTVQKGKFNVSVLLDFSGEEVWVAAP